MFKASEVLRFLGALAAGVALLLLLVLRVTGCAPTRTAQAPPPGSVPGKVATAPSGEPTDCRTPGWTAAAQANAATLTALAWAPFGREEVGWETYVPLVQNEIHTTCPPDSAGFAAALAGWEAAHNLTGDGIFDEVTFGAVKGAVQTRRDFVRLTSTAGCPGTPDLIVQARQEEGYAGKPVQLRPSALRAYRAMAAAARREDPRIAEDPRNLTIFSGYRSPAADAARCEAEGNCNGVVRARCSAHRTGLAVDVYVGQAPGYGPDSSADPNRLFMTRTPTYRWLVANAHRFGFVNYPFEPWHWEWTGEQP
jgi:uncharacterized protein YcbK (DUF882 family)